MCTENYFCSTLTSVPSRWEVGEEPGFRVEGRAQKNDNVTDLPLYRPGLTRSHTLGCYVT